MSARVRRALRRQAVRASLYYIHTLSTICSVSRTQRTHCPTLGVVEVPPERARVPRQRHGRCWRRGERSPPSLRANTSFSEKTKRTHSRDTQTRRDAISVRRNPHGTKHNQRNADLHTELKVRNEKSFMGAEKRT